MNTGAKALLSITASGALVLALGVSPVSGDTTAPSADDALEAIEAAAGLDAINATSVLDTGEELRVDADGLDVRVPFDASHGVRLGSGQGEITIDLPFEGVAQNAERTQVPGVVVYDNGNGSSTVPIVRGDGSVQLTTVIDSADSPSRYKYVIDLPVAATLIVDPEGAVSAPGVDPGIPLLYVAPPWARDANGGAVPTHYEVAGNTLTQVVDFTSQTAFPVVADPATYVDYTTASVINVVRAGTSTKWKYLNACTAAKNKSCSISRTYDVTSSVQTALSVSMSIVSASIGVSQGESISVSTTCGIPKGPGTATLYAQAAKTTYQVQTVRRWGVPHVGGGSMHTETKTSGTLTAYKPNGKFTCA